MSDPIREFVRAENVTLGRFLDDHYPQVVVGWSRTYYCHCGFTCHAPRAIAEHVAANHPTVETP